ncbi:MAG: GGDEF domain-containing protein, partial [Fimbriimonadaceae bacterium]|nr:GGDEF domain-containing protein [Fimbriimonadaceae bacterium]
MQDLDRSCIALDGSLALVLSREAAEEGGHELAESAAVPAVVMDAAVDLRDAAVRLSRSAAPAIWVVSSGRFLGLATLQDIVDFMSISRDPLTGLPWSDRLREWGRARLEEGREITVAFLDLNGFGRYNKTYGHIYGDRVLQALARKVESALDPEEEVFVRYGGDEFVIASLRGRTDLETLVQSLASEAIPVSGVPEEVRFTPGFSGGKRTRERTATHVAAMLDNLINLASQDMLRRKPSAQATAPIAEGLLARLMQERPELSGRVFDVICGLNEERRPSLRLVNAAGETLAEAPLTRDLGE